MKLDKPEFSLKDIYPDCINHYRSSTRTALMESITQNLMNDEKRYVERIKTKELYLEKEKHTHHKDITIKDMVNLYDRKLLNKAYISRKYYDKIRLSSKVCPFCGKRQTSTVDHFLPKTIYPSFVVTPMNLVPCCKDCNINKDDIKFTKEENMFFHPYEEDTDAFQWLIAKIEMKSGVIMFDFNVSDKYIDPMTFYRMYNQFHALQLKEYYDEEANIKFNRTKEFYKELKHGKNGKKQLKDHFLMEQKKNSVDKNYLNSFEYVYYSTLINCFSVVLGAL